MSVLLPPTCMSGSLPEDDKAELGAISNLPKGLALDTDILLFHQGHQNRTWQQCVSLNGELSGVSFSAKFQGSGFLP